MSSSINRASDLLLVNREGVDYKAPVSSVIPSVCDMEELPELKAPWDAANSKHHIIVNDVTPSITRTVRGTSRTNPAVKISRADKIYKLSGEEVSEINEPGEYIVTGDLVAFKGSAGDWAFGRLTDTSKRSKFTQMFYKCTNFTGKGLEYFDTGNVTHFDRVFEEARSFNYDISMWDTGSAVTMSSMFMYTVEFNQDIGKWDTSNVENMSSMFWESAMNSDIGDWDTGKVKTMDRMFFRASNFNQDIGDWDTSELKTASRVFSQSKAFNRDISRWNTGQVESMYGMFEQASAFNQDISSWNISKVENMDNMFEKAAVFNRDLSRWHAVLIPQKPDEFDTQSGFEGDTAKQPHWGR